MAIATPEYQTKAHTVDQYVVHLMKLRPLLRKDREFMQMHKATDEEPDLDPDEKAELRTEKKKRIQEIRSSTDPERLIEVTNQSYPEEAWRKALDILQ